MTLNQYKNLKIGDKVKLLVPITANSVGLTHPAGTILEVHRQTPRVRQSQGMPWFFWNCILPGTEEIAYKSITGITKPEEIELDS
jgi:hypothetical protein